MAWALAFPPMPATTGMYMARTVHAPIVPSNGRTTDAAKNASTRFTKSQGRRVRKLACHGLVSRSSGPAPNIRCTSSVASSSMMAMTSSAVTSPRSWPASSTTGSARCPCRRMSRATSSRSAWAGTARTSRRITRASGAAAGAMTRSRIDTTPESRPPASTT
jgi:hypothetical protein